MATVTPEALRAARLLFAGGPFLPKNNPPERLQQIAQAYLLAYPNEKPVNLGCSGCVARAAMQLEYFLNKHDKPATGPDAQQPLPPPPLPMAQQRRFTFRDPNSEYRPFGSPNAWNRHNLTDEAAQAIIKADPSARRLFIDADNDTAPEAVAAIPLPPGAEPAPSEPASTINGLLGGGTNTPELTKVAPGGSTYTVGTAGNTDPAAAATPEDKDEIIRQLRAQLEAKKPEGGSEGGAQMSAQAGGQGAGDPAVKIPEVGHGTDAASRTAADGTPSTPPPTTGVGNNTLPEVKDAANTAGTAKQPAPSALKQMTTAQLVAQYTTELGAAPDQAQLSTNKLLVDAIVGYREHLASL